MRTILRTGEAETDITIAIAPCRARPAQSGSEKIERDPPNAREENQVGSSGPRRELIREGL